MKSNITMLVTWIVQGIYTCLIGLNFLCIWLFNIGVPYVYPFAIIGHVILLFLPLELICLIVSLISLIREAKAQPRPAKMVSGILITLGVFMFICGLKLLLWNYGNSLAGAV